MSSHVAAQVTNPWLVHMARITAIRHEVADVLTYELQWTDSRTAFPGRPKSSSYSFLPGQFNMLYVPSCGEVAISMSGSPRTAHNTVVHTIRAVGRVTDAIAAMSVGDQLGVRGPYGSAWPIQTCHAQDVILLAGGIGLAPLRPAIYEMLAERQQFGRIVLLMGARSPDLMLYADEFDQWRARGMEVLTTVDRSDENWAGHVGVVPSLLDLVTDIRADSTVVMTCGPEIMMHYASIAALKRGIAPDRIWVSLERNMQCAVGLCGHCQLGPLFVCKDGPVVTYQRAEALLRTKEW